MNPGKTLLGALLGLASGDIAAQAHVPFEYYLASITVLGFVYAVLKAGGWFRGEVQSQIKAEFEAHAEKHRRLEDKVNMLIKAVDRIGGRGEDPAVTPVPFELPTTPIPTRKEG